MANTGSESRSSGWNRRFIEEHFSKVVADRLRTALMRAWRNDRPTLRSERADGEKNSYFGHWQLGLAAIAAEAEDLTWATKLSSDEAGLACRYVSLEHSGFPSWLDSLAQALPHVVEAVLGNELSEELAEPAVGYPAAMFLQNVRHAAPGLISLFLPRLRKWLRDNGGQVRPDEEMSAAVYRLSRVLAVLVNYGDSDTLDDVRQMAVAALQPGLSIELANVWLPVLLELDADLGVSVFEQMLSRLPIQRDGEAVAWFANLFGRHGDGGVNLSLPGFAPPLVLRLVRLAYIYVRIADDIEHEGVFSPDRRDNAQTGRGALLNALLAFEGEAGWAAKMQLANDPLFGHFRDRLIALAKETSSEEADDTAFDYAQFAALEQAGEAPPATRDAMFALIRDRLADLDDLLLQDVSPREGWAATTDERIMRRNIAFMLRTMANGCYTIDQEGVTADEKETDIRLRSVIQPQQGTIELKLGERYSGKELRDALRVQLVGQYMAAEACRAGCLLIRIAADRHWDHPDTDERMDLNRMLEFLNEEAAQVTQNLGGEIRVMVKALDLRPRLKPKPRKKNASRRHKSS